MHPNILLKKDETQQFSTQTKNVGAKVFFLSDGETNTGGVGEVVKLKLEAEFDYLRVTRTKK